MTFRETLSKMWNNINYTLFSNLESRTGPLSSEYKTLTAILELVRIEEFLPCTKFDYGRPVKDRFCIARAFIAKAVLKIPYNKQLANRLYKDEQLRIICGWDAWSKIPSESTLSRAFKEFSEASLPDKVHQLLIKEVYQGKIVGHVTKDSTALSAREKALKKEGTPKERKKQMNNRYNKEKSGELVSRRQKQLKHQTLEEMTEELPYLCDVGMKKNAQGYATVWKGYKLHVAIDDNCIALSAILTSASLNDCEAAIPLATKADKVVKNFYDLMDSAYDVSEVKEHSNLLGHVALIDKHARGKVAKEEKILEAKRKRTLNAYTAEDKRYRERFSKERFNAMYKDYYGGREIYYRGHSKVFCHTMFGILALTAATLLRFVQ